jgi:hypothetical protein
VSRSCEYSACSARWNAKRIFVRRWRDEASPRSSETLKVSKEGSEPECAGFMVANEEEEGSAECTGVGGRDTGWSPLGVSPSSGGFSQSSSSEGKRGRLFGFG